MSKATGLDDVGPYFLKLSAEFIAPCINRNYSAILATLQITSYAPTRELFENLNWLSFCDRISYNKLVLVYKILHDKTPNYLKKLCIPSNEVHTRNLRSVSSNNLAVIRPNTNIMKKSFAYSSAILWNKLPCNIKLSASLSIFKSKCFTYLKDISN